MACMATLAGTLFATAVCRVPNAAFASHRLLHLRTSCLSVLSWTGYVPFLVDAIVRVRACDVPSLFSLHMNGEAPPTPRFYFQAFGIDMGPFEKQSEYMKFTTPELVATRTRVLDYFAAQKTLVRDDH